MKLSITAPIFVKNQEHYKYLKLCTESFYSKDLDIVWLPIENYVAPEFRPLAYHFYQEPDEIHIMHYEGEQSVAKAWNLGIQEAKNLESDYVLVINTDIIFKKNAIDRLVAFAQTQKDAVMWTMAEWADLGSLDEAIEDENYSEHPHFSCFMVKPSIIDTIGTFDENFVPAYCEDGDYHARIALLNQKAYIYGGARFYHFGSRTIKSDSEAWKNNLMTFPRNQHYFLKKWGHPIVGDVEQMREVYYKYPYNDKTLKITQWR